jgi:NAD(P)-dependent dehydrogenase (short-subunit alcohol dehydrogenase family)
MIPWSQRRLHNLNAVVTGASSGIGQSIALMLAEEGANVALVARRLGLLRKIAAKCTESESKAVCYPVDLLNEKQIRALKKKVISDFGGVDILVHSAGVIVLCEVVRALPRDFDRQYYCNVRAPFVLTQVFLPSVVARKGQIVFINSTAGLQGSGGISQYAATKHALKGFADSLRQEINSEGVRVLSVYLGRTATPMQLKVHRLEGKDYHPEPLIQPNQVARIVVDALAMGREAEVTDLYLRPMQKPGKAAPDDREK